MHQLNSRDCRRRGAKGLKSESRHNHLFYKPVVLFDNIIKVFALPNLDISAFVVVVSFDPSGIGAALVDINFFGLGIASDSLAEKPQGCLPIALSCQQKVDRLALFVNGPIEILSLNPDIRFVHPPTQPDRAFSRAKFLLKQRREHGGDRYKIIDRKYGSLKGKTITLHKHEGKPLEAYWGHIQLGIEKLKPIKHTWLKKPA